MHITHRMSAVAVPEDSIGQELLAGHVVNWRALRSNSIDLAKRAETAEHTACDMVDAFHGAHSTYVALNKELDSLPQATAQLARLAESIGSLLDKFSRLEIALNLSIQHHNDALVAHARADAGRTLRQARERLHSEYAEARSDMLEARQRHVEAVHRAHLRRVSAAAEFAAGKDKAERSLGTTTTASTSAAAATAAAAAAVAAAAAAVAAEQVYSAPETATAGAGADQKDDAEGAVGGSALSPEDDAEA